MVKCLYINAYTNPVATTANITTYFNPVGGISTQSTSVETDAQLNIKTAGTFSKLQVRVGSNTVAGNTTFRVRKNAAFANQTITVGSSATGLFEDTTNTDVVAVNDLISIEQDPVPMTGVQSIYVFAMLFDTTTPITSTVTRMAYTSSAGSTSLTGASTTYYLPIHGQFTSTGGVNTTEATIVTVQRFAATFKNLAINVKTNARTATTVRFRKNTANGLMSITITASGTGIFEDTTNTDSVVDTDTVDYSITNGTGTSAVTYTMIAVDFVTTTNPGVSQYAMSVVTSQAYGPGARYCCIAGRFDMGTAETIGTQVKAQAAFTFKKLSVLVNSNTLSGASTFAFRVNAVDSTLSASIPATLSGTFTDLTDNVTVAAADLLNFRLNAGAGSTIGISSVNIFADITGGQALTRTIANSFVISDSNTRIRLLIHTNSEALTLTHASTNRIRFLKQTSNDSFVITDSENRYRGLVHTSSDSLTLSDSISKLRQKVRTFTNSLVLSESIPKLTTRLRTISDSLTLTHTSTNRFRLLLHTISDSLILSSTVSHIRNKLRTISQGLTLVDLVSSIRSKLKSATSSLTLSDSISRLRMKLRTIQDSLTLTSSLNKLTTRLRTISHTLTITEQFLQSRADKLKTITHMLSFSSDHSKITTRLKSITHALTLTSDHQRFRMLIQIFTDSITLTDSNSRLRGLIQTLTNNLQFTDSSTRLRNKIKLFTQNLTLVESIIKNKQKRVKYISESLTLTHTTNKLRNLKRSLTENISLTHTTNKYRQLLQLVSHALTFTDGITRYHGNMTKVFTQSITLVDTVTRQRFKSFYIRLFLIKGNK